MDEALVGAGRLGEAARGDAGVADVDEQALGGVPVEETVPALASGGAAMLTMVMAWLRRR